MTNVAEKQALAISERNIWNTAWPFVTDSTQCISCNQLQRNAIIRNLITTDNATTRGFAHLKVTATFYRSN